MRQADRHDAVVVAHEAALGGLVAARYLRQSPPAVRRDLPALELQSEEEGGGVAQRKDGVCGGGGGGGGKSRCDFRLFLESAENFTDNDEHHKTARKN